MNKWTEYSIEYANQRSYLDDNRFPLGKHLSVENAYLSLNPCIPLGMHLVNHN